MNRLNFLPIVLVLTACSPALEETSLPEHPEALVFTESEIEIPDANQYKHDMGNGNVAFVVEDHSLPLVKISITSHAGRYLMPEDDSGLSGITSSMLRDGGTKDLTPEALDERLDFLASSISASIGMTSSSASLNSLSDNLDETLDLLFDMITEPRFDAERLAIHKGRVLESMKRRNDDTRSIEPRYWNEIIRGEGFFTTLQATQAQVEAIDAERMLAATKQAFTHGNLVISVSGDVNAMEIVAKLNEQLARLPDAVDLPEIPDDTTPAPPGLYGVNKGDVNQTRVRIGHPGPRHGHPDQFAIAIMNNILGGGGFTSRITSRVRADEGLAYSAGSLFALGRDMDGEFRAVFQSKNPSVPQAVAIVLEEINRIRTEPVTDKEIEVAKEAVIAGLNELFTNASRRASRFAQDEFNGEDDGYWNNYEANVRSVTIEDVQRVAETWLQPDQLRILVTGRLDEAVAGDGEHGSLEEVTGMQLQQLQLKDPLTLEPLPL
jgi:predicted Zn-dependent peptidase